MNQRERILAILVGILAVVGVGFMGWQQVDGMLRARRQQMEGLDKQIRDKNFTIAVGSKASKELAELKERSLPPEIEDARKRYQEWLVDLAITKTQLKNVKPMDDLSRRSDVYHQLKFVIDGELTLPQLTEFLYQFYSTNDLHRIASVNLTPGSEAKKLKMTTNVEALILKGAPAKEEVGKLVDGKLEKPLDQVVSTVVGRNLFSPANKPPVLSRIQAQSIELGNSLDVDLSAEDPDSGDELAYSLVGEAPEGLRLSNNSVRWRPKEVGEYQLTVQVSDNGFPALTDQKSFVVKVSEPPPPPQEEVVERPPPRPRFDHAEHAYVTAIMQVDGEAEVWFFVRTTGETMMLKVGDEINVGSVTGTVADVTLDLVKIETEDGTLQTRIGENLTTSKTVATAEGNSDNREL